MDQTERYIELAQRGRDAFLSEAAPAALVRRRERAEETGRSSLLGEPVRVTQEEETLLARIDGSFAPSLKAGDYMVYPLVKKAGAPFADMIMIGRTANNDIVLKDVTISRFHAFFRDRGEKWIVCDAGSKNGTSLNDNKLAARVEHPVQSGDAIMLGDIAATFYTAAELYDVLSDEP